MPPAPVVVGAVPECKKEVIPPVPVAIGAAPEDKKGIPLVTPVPVAVGAVPEGKKGIPIVPPVLIAEGAVPEGKNEIPIVPPGPVAKGAVPVPPVDPPLMVPLPGMGKGAELGTTLGGGGVLATVIVTVMVMDSVIVTGPGQLVGATGPLGKPAVALSSGPPGLTIVPFAPGPLGRVIIPLSLATPDTGILTPGLVPVAGPTGDGMILGKPDGRLTGPGPNGGEVLIGKGGEGLAEVAFGYIGAGPVDIGMLPPVPVPVAPEVQP